MYLNSRNREKARMENIDTQRQKEEEDRAFQEKLALNKKMSEDRVQKNAKKRQKAKARKDNFKKKQKTEGTGSNGAVKSGDESGSDQNSDEEEAPQEY